MDDSRTLRSVATIAGLAVVLASLFGVGASALADPASAETGALGEPNGTATATPTANESLSDSLTAVTENTTETVENTTETVENTTDAVSETTENTTDSVSATVENTTDSVSETTENATDSVTNTTDSVTNTTDSVTGSVENTTDSVADTTTKTVDSTTNTTGSVTAEAGNTTDSVVDGVANTTGSVTETTGETVGNTTDSLTNTTDRLTNETDGVTNATENVTSAVVDESDDLVGANLTGTAVAGVNATVDATSLNGSVQGESGSGTTTATPMTESSPTPGASTGGEEPTSGSDTPSASNADGSDGTEGEETNGSSAPSRGGAAAGGVLVVAGVSAAAASKHVAANTAVAQGRELAWLGRVGQLEARGMIDALRGQLGRIPRVIVPPGYSRHDDSDPLEHETRRELFETAEASPGVNLSTLAEECDASLSTVRHHLRILEEEHLLVSERIRGQRRYFPSNEAEPALVAALDDTATEPILRTLAQSGPASVSDLADALGRDPSTISHHLSRLEDDGLIERERDGRSVQNRLSPVAERVLTGPGSAGAPKRPVATE